MKKAIGLALAVVMMMSATIFCYANVRQGVLADDVTSGAALEAYDTKDIITIDVEGGKIYFDKVSGAITDCDRGVTSADIPSVIEDVPVTGIGSYAFFGCYNLNHITIPDSVTVIGSSGFYGCNSLTDITIPDSVTGIGNSVFMGCSGLTHITIPGSVTSIGESVFEDCRSLTKIDVDENNGSYVSVDGVLYNKDKTTLICCPSAQTSITIPNSVTSIVDYGFYGCSGLTEITLPSGVTSIGNYGFYGCSSLTGLKVPGGVTSIGRGAFENCSNLSKIDVDENNNSYVSIDGVLYNKDVNTLICCPGAKKSIAIPKSVTNIEKVAFEGCVNLTRIRIPDKVTTIGEGAFSYCNNLTSAKIPKSVTIIDDDAFWSCSSLNHITIPGGVTYIRYGTFSGCTGLTSVTIFDGVAGISNFAFRGCSNLTGIAVPSSVTSIGNYAFNECDKEKLIFYVEQGSFADTWAQDNGFKVSYVPMEEVVDVIYGDANDDGELDASDSALVLQYTLNRNVIELDEEFEARCDVDGESGISSNDAAFILQKVLDNSFVFPV